jgi:hypothetical protein
VSIELAVREAVSDWAPTAPPSWDDVLRRARPVRPRRRAALAAAAALALVLALPGLGIGERLTSLISGEKRPGLELGAQLVRADGTHVGTFSVSTSRLFITAAKRRQLEAHPYAHVGAKGPGGLAIRWTLDLNATASAAWLETRDTHRRIVSLCAPCRAGKTDGRRQLRRGAFTALFGRADVVVRTTEGDARGRVRFQKPVRR